MTPAAPQRRICQNCRASFVQPARPGRPSTMCSEPCKRAARRKSLDPPDLSMPETDMDEAAEDLNRMVSDLLAAVQGRAPSAHLLHHLTVLKRMVTDTEAAVVRRGRVQGDTWDTLAAPAGLSSERLRKKWTEETLTRRLDNRRAARGRGASPLLPAPRPPADATPLPPAGTALRPPTHTPAQHLAGALTSLQRKTGRTLKDIAAASGVSASHVSRILSGQRLPSWPVAERLARTCDGNPEELRALWEAAQRPPDPEACTRPPAPHHHDDAKRRFHTALRALYLAADRPHLWAIRRAAGNTLGVNHIARALNGTDVPDWHTTTRLVAALQGRPADLRPLWNAAYRTPPPDAHGPHLPAGAFG